MSSKLFALAATLAAGDWLYHAATAQITHLMTQIAAALRPPT